MNLLAGYLYKRCKVGEGNRLSSVLVGSNLGNDLGGNVAGCRKRVRAFNQCSCNNRAILEHIFQIDKIAVMHVLCIVVAVMEMDDSFLMRFHDVLWKKNPVSQIAADFTGNVITLGGIYNWVLIRILLFCFFIVAFNEREDAVVRCVALADE